MNNVAFTLSRASLALGLIAPVVADINAPENYPKEYKQFLLDLDAHLKENGYDFSTAANTVFLATKDELAMPLWMKKAAEEGHPVAIYYLANERRLVLFMSSPDKADGDEAAAIYKMYEQSAKKGFVPAIIHQAGGLINGIGVEKNKEEAIRLLADASREGNKHARLRWLQLTERFVSEEDIGRKEVAFEIDRGNDFIILEAARLTKDPKKRVEYLRKAAELNNGNAYSELSRIISSTDPAGSFSLAIKGAQAFNAECMATIGYRMIDPNYQQKIAKDADLPYDPAKGMYLLKVASMLHAPYAHTLLGKIYQAGLFGVARNESRAFRHFEHATLRRDRQGQLSYAYCLLKGLGTTAQPKIAMRHLLYLARQNVAPAIALIAYCHFKGLGVEKDPKEAAQVLEDLALTYPIAYIYLADLKAREKDETKRDESAAEHYLRLAGLAMSATEVERIYKLIKDQKDWVFDL